MLKPSIRIRCGISILPATLLLMSSLFAVRPALAQASVLTSHNDNPAPVNVFTSHNDNARSGLNAGETWLAPANVNPQNFGKLFSQPVDGSIYAQPLLVSGVSIPGKGIHDVVYVATLHNSVYAFDADNNLGMNTGPLWKVNLGPSAPTPNNDFGNRYGPYGDISPEIGIVGTPTIDPLSKTLYAVAFIKRGGRYFQMLHALDLATGAERPGSPVNIQGKVPGRGDASINGVLTFDPMQHMQRCALLLQNGMLYVTFGSHADTDPYHGWVYAYSAKTLALRSIWVSTPNGNEGALWQSGAGPAADSNGYLYFETGNGTFTSGINYGDSFVRLKLDCNTPLIADFFTPYNQGFFEAVDEDLGSGGLMLLPPEVGSALHRNLIVGAGKEGTVYLIDRDKMGRYRTTDDTQIVQADYFVIGGAWSSPAYWNHNIYYQGSGDSLKTFSITNGVISITPIANSGYGIAWPGATPSVSANGAQNGIVWTIDQGNANALLHAYDATNVGIELYNSSQAGTRDQAGPPIKFTVPTIANGKVYIGTATELDVYGLFSEFNPN